MTSLKWMDLGLIVEPSRENPGQADRWHGKRSFYVSRSARAYGIVDRLPVRACRRVCYLVNPIIRDDEIRRPRIAFSLKSLPRNRTNFRGMTKCDKEQAKTSPWRQRMSEAKWNYEQTTRSWTSYYYMKERRLERWKVGWMRFFPGSLKNDDLCSNQKKTWLNELGTT